MEVSLLQVAGRVKQLKPSKWLIDEHHLAFQLGISAGQLATFSRCIECGGTEVDGAWKSNPVPHNEPIDLLDTQTNNALKLHRMPCGGNKAVQQVDLVEPSSSAISQGTTYYRVGGVSASNKKITPQTQREIIRWVIGTHKALKTAQFAAVGVDRRRIWSAWALGEDEGSIYQTRHLPWIVQKYASIWGVEVDARIYPPNISASVLEHCRREIVELLVASFVLPHSALDRIAVRRSNRHGLAEDDIVIREPSRKRKRLTPRPVSSPEEDLSDASDAPTSILHLFNLGELKELVRAGEMKEVGRREVALSSAHGGMSRQAANQSQWLATLAEGEKEEREKMRAIISSAGDQICNQKQWQSKTIDAAEVTIDFQLTHVVDPELTNPDEM